MKTGITLTALATEIERRRNAKSDFIAPASHLTVAVDQVGTPTLKLGNTGNFDINSIAHEQLADYAGIPMPYYRRMLADDPQLLADNINRWLRDKAESKDRRMIRTLDNSVRAVLSDKYRTLENEDMAEAVLPVLQERDLLIMSCDITDSRLYIKAVDRSIEQHVPTGKKMGDGSHTIFDVICPAITISNSEVGRGSLMIESGVFTKACTNLATFGASMRKYHTGARAEISDDVFALLSDKTRRLTDAALWAQARDLVAAAFDKAKFEATAARLAEATEDKIKADVVEVIERLGRKTGLADGERKGVLHHLIEGGDLTRYGLHSAVTRFSQDVENYDRATELERIGARVIELGKHDWKVLAAA